MRRVCSTLVAMELVAVGALVAYGGFFLEAPSYQPTRSDLIVVLGGATVNARLQKGAELYRKGLAGRLLVTGFSEPGSDATGLVLDWRQSYLERLGVARDSIVRDASAKSSWEEAFVVRSVLREQHGKSALVVSDPPHLRRLSWVFHRVFEGSGLEYRLIASEPPWWNPSVWWANSASASFVILELVKLGYYAVEHP